MNLQHERIDALCQQLKLERVATHYPVLAQQAVREDFSFTDFLEHLLRHEAGCRQQRSRELLTRMACFPGIKTLEDYDFSFNPGVPKALVQELGSLAFVEPRQPGGCKLKTAPVRPVVAARPAEYVCSEDLFY